MPLTRKGEEILANMRSQYGPKKGTSVFYASRNKGTITGVDPESSHGRRPIHHSPFHGRVTGDAQEAEGQAPQQLAARNLSREVGGALRNTPGLQQRRNEVIAAQQDAEPADEAEGLKRGAMGSMAARAGVRRAQAAYNRQARVAGGQSLYDTRGRFIGNKKPD
jgi:hypothetical protein